MILQQSTTTILMKQVYISILHIQVKTLLQKFTHLKMAPLIKSVPMNPENIDVIQVKDIVAVKL